MFTSQCFDWKAAVAVLLGKRPSSWKSSITSCRLLSRVLRRLPPAPSPQLALGVRGELTPLSHPPSAPPVLKLSGLKSGPKKVFPEIQDNIEHKARQSKFGSRMDIGTRGAVLHLFLLLEVSAARKETLPMV